MPMAARPVFTPRPAEGGAGTRRWDSDPQPICRRAPRPAFREEMRADDSDDLCFFLNVCVKEPGAHLGPVHP